MNLQQRTIIITGGTSGLGLALVKMLAQASNQLIVIGRNRESLNELANQYPEVTPYLCDLASPRATEKTAQRIINEHSNVSILINNAAVQHSSEHWLNNFCLENTLTEVQTNLITPVLLSALFAKAFHKQNQPCAIVNISSALAIAPKTQAPVYCATKAALSNFSHSLRYQLAGTLVQVNDVILPLVDTPMTRGRGANKLPAAQAAQAIIKGITQNRPTIYVGKAKYLPWLMRISPSLVARILQGAN